jgi:anthranilate synthase component 2
MKVLVLDNYDSFTYNLVHILRELQAHVEVKRNDKLTLADAESYEKILFSPGPGIPDEAGLMKPIIHQYRQSKSMLGICLGHQAIAEVFGASLQNIPQVLHGVTSQVTVVDADEPLFTGVPNPFQATHYHSWVVRPESIPSCLRITATNADGLVMGIRHVEWDIRGLQFHPESIMTPEGARMIRNWLENYYPKSHE